MNKNEVGLQMNKYHIRRLPLNVAIGSVLATGTVQAATITVDSAADGPLGTYATDCTLRAAIAAANTNTVVDGCAEGDPGLDQIEFDPALANSVITLTDGQLDISESVNISGPVSADAAGLVLSGDYLHRVLNIEGGAPDSIDVSLDSLTVRDGHLDYNTYDQGAGIRSINANLNLSEVSITNNYAYYGGAGLWLEAGSLNVQRSTVSNNSDGYFGGAGGGITARFSEVTISESQITGNSAAYAGGGLVLDNASATVSDTFINNNSVQHHFGTGGGGIDARDSELTLIDSRVNNNTVSQAGRGGGIRAFNTELTLSGTEVNDNAIGYYSGVQSGAGLSIIGGSLSLLESEVSGNRIDSPFSAGAGIRASSLVIDMQRSTVSDNQLDGNYVSGGGFYVDDVSGTIAYSEISANEVIADYAGGAGMTMFPATLTLINTTVSGNTVTSYNPGNTGAASSVLLSSTSSLALIHATVADNGPGGDQDTRTLQVAGSSSFTLVNSLISGPPDLVVCSTQASSSNQSLASDATCTGSATDPADLGLQPLNDNGGPTRTHALAATSLAIDAAGDCFTDAGILTDQRGNLRDADCDIGAYEFTDDVFNDRFEQE